MKQFFTLSIALLLLSSYDALEFMSPSESPLLSPSSQPSSNNDCSTVVYSMLDCLSFLSVGSTDLSPTKTCCDGVETVLQYNSSCLCVALESSRAMGFDLINSRAVAIPSTCNIPIDPHCEDALSPAPSTPIASPSPVSPLKPPTTSPPSNSSPRRTTPPTVTPSSPANSHSSPAKTASPPRTAHSASTITAPSPAIVAPSPSKSGTKILSVSKLFLTIMIISSFVYVLA